MHRQTLHRRRPFRGGPRATARPYSCRPRSRRRTTKVSIHLAALAAAGALAGGAHADGLPVLDIDAGPTGVASKDSRYVTLHPARKQTLVARISRGSGHVVNSRVLRGRFTIPAVAYDGAAAGLSADARTLVLISPRPGFPRRTTEFALLDAQTLRLRDTLRLRGDFSFDALSPDARRLYLIHYTSKDDPLQYDVRAFDVAQRKLDPRPIVDPREPDEEMNGHPLTRATSPDGRWAYTLYEGSDHPFVHALDTVNRDARCIDLDWLHGRKDLWQLRFGVAPDGRDLSVNAGGKPVAVVQTATWEATRPPVAADDDGPAVPFAFAGAAAPLASVRLLYAFKSRTRSRPAYRT